MKISLKWLRDYAALDAPARVLADQLMNSGTEVDHVEEQLAGVVVAKILGIAPVPESTKGVVFADIDTGREQVRVLTGAPNLQVGALVPYAPPGTRLPGWEEPLAVKEMFGGKYRSPGMLCADDELGIGKDHSGIHIFNGEAKVGQSVSALLGSDVVFTVEVTPNRYDAACHLGLARELAAVRGEELRLPDVHNIPRNDKKASDLAKVTVEKSAGCARFVAMVVDKVKVGPSPGWIQERLAASGLRPISNLVDVTNFLALECGEPLHAFDYQKFCELGRTKTADIRVRRARAGETLACLDGVVRKLDPEDTVVCSGDVAVSLAGVMGGAETAVSENTKAVLLEAATWDGPRVRATSQRHALRSEASTRFSKGLSDRLPVFAVERAAKLVCETAGGTAATGLVDVWERPLDAVNPITLSMTTIGRVLGFAVHPDEVKDKLTRLGFSVQQLSQDIVVQPPSWRRDVWLAEDVIEEVGRMLGYEKVPATLPGSREKAGKLAQPLDSLERIREICLSAGFDEAVTWSFASEKNLDLIPGIGRGHSKVALRNPLNENWTVMRTSQLPGLMEVAAYNLNHEIATPRLFEIGPCFWADRASDAEGSGAVGKDWTPLPGELKTLSLVASCDSADLAATAIRQMTDVLASVGHELAGKPLSTSPTPHEWLQEGRSADVLLEGKKIGAIGEVKRLLSSKLEVAGRAVVAEIDLTEILRGTPGVSYRLPGKFPAVTEDIAVVVSHKSLARNALSVIRKTGGPLLQEVELYDEYRDERMDASHKSWTFRLVFRSDQRTLVADEVAAARAQVVAALEKVGAKLRT